MLQLTDLNFIPAENWVHTCRFCVNWLKTIEIVLLMWIIWYLQRNLMGKRAVMMKVTLMTRNRGLGWLSWTGEECTQNVYMKNCGLTCHTRSVTEDSQKLHWVSKWWLLILNFNVTIRLLSTSNTVSQKMGHFVFGNNFAKCWPIFKILLLLGLAVLLTLKTISRPVSFR